MKNIVFIVTDRNRANLYVGLSADLKDTMDFYRKMPNLLFDAGKQLTRLVYFEEYHTEQQASERFKELSAYTRAQKEKLIRNVNTDWTDLSLALAYEQTLKTTYKSIQPVFSYAS